MFPPVSWSWGMRISHPVGYLVHLPFLCFPFPSKVFPKGEAKALNFVRYQTGFSVLTHLYKHRLHLCSDFFLGRDFLPLFAHLKYLQAAKYLSHSQPYRASIFHPSFNGACWIPSAARSKSTSISPKQNYCNVEKKSKGGREDFQARERFPARKHNDDVVQHPA